MLINKASELAWLNEEDREGKTQVIAFIKISQIVQNVVYLFAAQAVAIGLLLAHFERLNLEASLYVCGGSAAIAGIFALISRFEVLSTVEAYQDEILIAFGVIGLLTAMALGLNAKSSWPAIVGVSLAAGIVLALIAALLAALLSYIVGAIIVVWVALGVPIGYPLMVIGAYCCNQVIRMKYTDWRTSTGTPVFKFGAFGVKDLHVTRDPIYSSTPRTQGNARGVAAHSMALGSILGVAAQSQAYSSSAAHTDLYTPSAVFSDAYTDTGAQADVFADEYEYSYGEFDHNPANGLPMIGGIGGVDVSGNVYGTDHNHI